MTPVELQLLNNILIIVTMAFVIANVALLSKLIRFYKESYKEIESKITMSLLYFTSILLIGNLLVFLGLLIFLGFAVEITELGGTLMYIVLFLISIAQTIAYSILYKVTYD